MRKSRFTEEQMVIIPREADPVRKLQDRLAPVHAVAGQHFVKTAAHPPASIMGRNQRRQQLVAGIDGVRVATSMRHTVFAALGWPFGGG